MNIIQPGDHVIIAMASSYSVPGTVHNVEKVLKDLPDGIEGGFGSDVSFSMSWLPVAGPDANPYVLCVIRKATND